MHYAYSFTLNISFLGWRCSEICFFVFSGTESDDESCGGSKAVTETESFDVIPFQSGGSQDSTSSSSAAHSNDTLVSGGQRFSQQISREDIDNLVQAITEVQSSVIKSEGLRRNGRLIRLRSLLILKQTVSGNNCVFVMFFMLKFTATHRTLVKFSQEIL